MTNQEQIQRFEDPGTAASNAVTQLAKKTAGVAKDHPRTMGLWALGLVLLVFGQGFRVSEEAMVKYETGMAEADESERIHAAAHRYNQMRQNEYAASGFFSCDDQCQYFRRGAADAERELTELRRVQQAKASTVKAQIGVFSEYGVAEVKDSFWATFAGGKAFAKRQSMWDLLFRGLSYSSSSRDENMAAVVIRWFIQLLFNFTLGLCGGLLVFYFKLWSLISSYQPDPLTALAFAAAAALAATAMVAFYLFLMYFCAASGVAAVGAAASAQARIEAARRNDPRRVQYGAAAGPGPGPYPPGGGTGSGAPHGVRYRRQQY